MKATEELKKMSIEELKEEEDKHYQYSKLVETIWKAKQRGIIE